ncbi:MAG: MBL fold metallo-hydrolase [Pseudomonadota bacterium]
MKRLFLGLGIIVMVLAALAAVAFNTTAGQDALFRRAFSTAMAQAPEPPEGLRVVVCGSASPLGNILNRAQACIAVLTAEHFFLFDVGARSPLRIAQARLPMRRLDGVFLTHFHSDHIAGIPDANLASWVQGRRESLKIYGPAGVESVVGGFNQAYRLDRRYRIAHHGVELLPPAAGPMTPVTIPQSGTAWQDDALTVTVFSVNHNPIEPAVGYRVDYRGRSVVISGDTIADGRLFEAAAGADLLLHDALSRAMLDTMIEIATENEVPVLPTIMTDVIDYHADSLSLEDRAAAAGIRQLAYYHLVPAPPNALAEKIFARGLADSTLLVRDLHTFDLPPDSDAIIISEP